MNRRSKSGYTLVELVVAITLGLFVATLIFAAYTDVFKGFRKQAHRADRIRVMVRIKQELDRSLRKADQLSMVSAKKIAYVERGDHAEHTITFYDSTIFRDNIALQSGISDCTFTASDDRTEQGFRVVRWEVLLSRGGWVGGVTVLQGQKKE